MTQEDWARIHKDTESAIEHMKKLIEIAEVGKKQKDKKQ